jgi:hypothetical protein
MAQALAPRKARCKSAVASPPSSRPLGDAEGQVTVGREFLAKLARIGGPRGEK